MSKSILATRVNMTSDK